ncbi:MAG: hypothetical protein R8K46_10905, partial [Mariprofundaceae bacterium]
DVVSRKTLRALIADQGHEAICFDGAKAYVEFFSSPAYMLPTAIMADGSVDGTNMVELIRHVRSRVPFQKIAVFSGAADFAHNARAERCHVLPKPFEYETIRSFVQTMLACEKDCAPGIQCHAQSVKGYVLDHGCPFAP